MQLRNFQGVFIPANVWLDTKLTALDKMVLMEITSLDVNDGCYASNEYLAKFCQCSESKITKTISKLKKLKYIEQVGFDGRNRYLHSRVVNFTTLNSKKCDTHSINRIKGNIDKNIVSRDYTERVYDKEELESIYVNYDTISDTDL